MGTWVQTQLMQISQMKDLIRSRPAIHPGENPSRSPRRHQWLIAHSFFHKHFFQSSASYAIRFLALGQIPFPPDLLILPQASSNYSITQVL
jgi:hypothetical protein